MEKKYILYPGMIRSKDGDWHYIGFLQLARLYKVNIHECINGSYIDNLKGIDTNNYIELYPTRNGNYSERK